MQTGRHGQASPGNARYGATRGRIVFLVLALLLPAGGASGQQFNSDNYLTMPHGTVTSIVTVGSEWNMWYISAALFKNWEFFMGGVNVWEDEENDLSSHFTATAYAKYMFHENAAKNAGFAVAAGVGSFPGYLDQERRNKPFHQIWVIPELTLPFFSGKLLWDLNPGVAANFDTDPGSDDTAWGFTWSTRVAVYGIVPRSALVGEAFGSTGDLAAPAQYKAGLRWEPSQYFAAATTWGGTFDGSKAAGFEVGVMIFSPRFACFGGCDPDEY